MAKRAKRKVDGRKNNKGRAPTGVGEDAQLVRGPAAVIQAMRAVAERRGCSVAFVWRAAAEHWLTLDRTNQGAPFPLTFGLGSRS